MLVRHMVGYAPSLIVTGIVSLAGLTFFTHLLSQAEYGQYALAITVMTMLVGVCFSWLQNAASRLMPQATAKGYEDKFISTLYTLFVASGLIVLALAVAVIIFVPLGDWRVAAWFAPPLAILRALLNINQALHRNFVRIKRYNIIEIGQSVIGLGAALALITVLHRGASDPALGAILGLVLMSVFDWRLLAQIRRADIDPRICKELLQFGLPFIANFGFSFILAGSDRFLIEHFLGSDQVGVYSAGYAFPDRIGQYLFMAVATASFPLIVRRLEQEGIEAAREQTYLNGVALLSLAIPACVGMLLLNRQIATTLIGQNFREGAMTVMPLITIATIFNGVATHYFDHALHLAKKTRLYFYTLGPAALFNLAANFYAIPRYGIIGAAWTTLLAYGLYLALSIGVGRRVFRIKFPFKPAAQIIAATAVMALVLSLMKAPENLFGLSLQVFVGAAVYGLGLWVFDVIGVRSLLRARFHPAPPSSAEPTGPLTYDILASPLQIEAIADEWRLLYRRKGRCIFGSYEWFQIWLQHLGQGHEIRLHIAVARTASGEMTALIPLVVRRAGLVRLLEWAGYEVFDYGGVLAEDEATATALWHFVWATGGYDIALIKDVPANSVLSVALSSLMKLRERRKNYFLTLEFNSGDAWLAAQSRKLRGDVRRKTEKMQAKGDVAFHVWPRGDLVPSRVIDAIYAQKSAWLEGQRKSGVFALAEMKGFLHDLAHQTAREENLYLAWLTCGEAIVACHMGFIRGDVLYLYLTTYDGAYGAYSPGNILMIETIKRAIDSRWVELDFMRGDETYKQRFASGFRALSVFMAGRSGLGKLLVALRGRGGDGDAADAPFEP